jgi:hypothetical protein
MIVGGYAVAFHGSPRFTKDIDVFVDGGAQNIERLRDVLKEFGFSEQEIPSELFAKGGEIISFGVPPVRIDLVGDIDGVTFSEAKPNSVRGRYGQVEVTFMGLEDLLRNKRSSPRARDKADVEELTS